MFQSSSSEQQGWNFKNFQEEEPSGENHSQRKGIDITAVEREELFQVLRGVLNPVLPIGLGTKDSHSTYNVGMTSRENTLSKNYLFTKIW